MCPADPVEGLMVEHGMESVLFNSATLTDLVRACGPRRLLSRPSGLAVLILPTTVNLLRNLLLGDATA